MEVLSSSFFTPKPFSLHNLTKKTLLKLHKTHLKSFKTPSFPTSSSPLSNPKHPLILSQFGRPSKRRNSLRKKLTNHTNDTQVIPKDSSFIDLFHHFVDNQVNQAKLDSDKFENGSGKNLGDSILWNKLEGWVELYKKDIEFWGIGSNPIFIVFQDCSNNGRIDKVLVDESEILRRNGVNPLYYKKGSELEEFSEVKSKISHARFLARELESGKDVIPRNSSVAKFVVKGEDLGLVTRIRSISVPKNVVIKVSRIGIVVVCGVLFVWTMRKLLGFGGKEVEMTSFEKEMLRRKMKARAEKEEKEKEKLDKEKLEKGSVIVEELLELPDVVIRRPQLDKEGVFDGIRKAKGTSSDLAVIDVGGASSEMDFKIKEIQRMAKRAREIERGECSEGNDLGKDNLVKGKDKSIQFDEFEKQSSIAQPTVEEYGADEHVEGFISGNFTEARAIDGISETKLSERRDYFEFPSDEGSEKKENVEPHNTSSEKVIIDQRRQMHVARTPNLTGRALPDVSNSNMSPPVKKPMRRMPRIIRSVKEAREYLSLKNDKKLELGDVSDIDVGTTGGINSYVSQRLEENGKALESSDVNVRLNHDHSVDVGEYEAVKEMETLLNEEPQMDIIPPSNLNIYKDSSIDMEPNFGKTSDIDLCEKAEAVSGETFTHETIPDVNDGLSSVERLDKIDDGTLQTVNLSEKADFVPGIISAPEVGNSSGVSDTHNGSALPYDDLQERETLLIEKDLAGDSVDDSGPRDNAIIPTETNDPEMFDKNYVKSTLPSTDTFLDSNSCSGNKVEQFADKESWLEKNFHEMDPIVNKIRSGFKDNYMVAREKVKQGVGPTLDYKDLISLSDDSELEWMKDDKLRDIVFKVRDNELAGRDPFHSMELDDKAAFFKGLESIADKENQKLATLHQWLHSNIENLDYGADGISIYDPPEKIIPRWKGPPLDDLPEFLSNAKDQHEEAHSLQKGNQSTEHNFTETSQEASITKPRPEKKVSKFPKTVIESSDGSIKPGKKSGKEYWQHTKKWSRGFLESYNAETDPEVKATMKDIGKDLDRWMTEKDIQEAADLMDKIPQRGKDFIEKKMKKLKREMELFGPQAVVSKYREYSDDKEEDYLWWLDLPHVLCIELYTYEGEDQEVGFYTLEMAEDLELEPKPQHLIAFQDPGDCKNFCYIMQAHLEMLGKGKAFIVPQHPKDVYRQAKADGFGITVIRKGEVKLNVDQPLEEVEELISEIGSKMYHDKIMKERSVDISSLMTGVFGLNKLNKRKRKKRNLKRLNKS